MRKSTYTFFVSLGQGDILLSFLPNALPLSFRFESPVFYHHCLSLAFPTFPLSLSFPWCLGSGVQGNGEKQGTASSPPSSPTPQRRRLPPSFLHTEEGKEKREGDSNETPKFRNGYGTLVFFLLHLRGRHEITSTAFFYHDIDLGANHSCCFLFLFPSVFGTGWNSGESFFFFFFITSLRSF